MTSWEDDIAEEIRTTWGKEPKSAQVRVIKQLIAPSADGHIPVVVYVDSTGSGKSLTAYGTISILGGLLLYVSPLITLSTDQEDKIRRGFDSRYGHIHVFNLNNARTQEKKDEILSICDNFDKDSADAVVLVFSPQTILDNANPWFDRIKQWNEKRLVQLLVLDEVQSYVFYGLSLRPEFPRFVEVIKILCPDEHPDRHCPVLITTASYTLRLHALIQRMTGLTIATEDVLWAPDRAMSKRTISIHLRVGPSILSTLGYTIQNFLSGDPNKKAVIYSHTPAEAANIKEGIDAKMDRCSDEQSCIKVVGLLDSPVKSEAIRTFTGADPCDEFFPCPRALSATLGVAGPGIDDSNLYLGIAEMPESVISLYQILGRLARRQSAAVGHDHFYLVANITTFVYLFLRAYDSEAADLKRGSVDGVDFPFSPAEVREYAIDMLFEVLDLLFINRGCVHQRFEKMFGCPAEFARDDTGHDHIDSLPSTCGGACFICGVNEESYAEYVPPVKKSGLQEILLNYFVRNGQQTLVGFAEGFAKETGLAADVYGMDDKSLLQRHVHATALQLVAAKILICEGKMEKRKDNKWQRNVFVKLDLPALNSASAWKGIGLIQERSSARNR